MIRALGSSRYSLWSTVIRTQVQAEIGGAFSDPFCDLLNKRYMAELRAKRMFTNELYLTIVRSGMRGALGAAETSRGLLDQVVRPRGAWSSEYTSVSTSSRRSSATSFASSRNTARARSASSIAMASRIRNPASSSTRF